MNTAMLRKPGDEATGSPAGGMGSSGIAALPEGDGAPGDARCPTRKIRMNRRRDNRERLLVERPPTNEPVELDG